jgi:hypothetical protein
VIRAHGAWRTLAPLAPDSSRYLCFGLRATRTTEKVRPGHRFCSGDPRNPLFDPDLVACAQVRGAGGYERRRGARREARRATCSWSRRAAGRTPQPTSGATRVTGGGSWAWAASADGSGGRAVAKATIHPPNRPVLREPRARALLLPLGIFAMPAAHAAHICGDNVGAPERLEHPEQLFAHKWQCQRLDSSSEEGKDARLYRHHDSSNSCWREAGGMGRQLGWDGSAWRHRLLQVPLRRRSCAADRSRGGLLLANRDHVPSARSA